MQLQEAEQEPSLEAMLPQLDLSDSKTKSWLNQMAEQAQAKQALANSFKSQQGSDEAMDLGANHMHRSLVRRQSEGPQGQTQS